MKNAITEFQGRNRFLSNFWPAVVVFEGVFYPSVEHGYQAAKTLDLPTRRSIAALASPGEAKRAGRTLTVRPNWEEIKVDVMQGLLEQKFSIPELRAKLLNTGNAELIEGNAWGDRFWGVCGGTGRNVLGRLLMQIRLQIQSAL